MESMEKRMMTVIEDMKNRGGADLILRAKHYGFLWGITWMAERLGYKEVRERGYKDMKTIDEELKLMRTYIEDSHYFAVFGDSMPEQDKETEG